MPEEFSQTSDNQGQEGQSDAATGVSEETQTGAIGEGQDVQPAGQEGNVGEEKLGKEGDLPPELEETRKQLLRDWHAKNQKLADDKRSFESEMQTLKKDAQTLQGLFEQEWFKKALTEERARRDGKGVRTEITDEEYQAAQTDKSAFENLVARKALEVVKSEYGSKLSEFDEKVSELSTEREFEVCAQNPRMKDFRDLNAQGAFDPYLQKGYSYEDAYIKYKYDNSQDNSESKIHEEAEKILAAKKAGSVEKSGITNPKGARIVKVVDADAAFDQAWDAYEKGQEVDVVKE